MNNYPPGMSKRDFVRAGIDQPHAHEHEFTSEGMDGPIIEDGAAIFREECWYAEGEYGQGWECEESRTYRFEYSTLESPDGEVVELPTIAEWPSDMPDGRDGKVVEIEEAFHTHGPGDLVSFDVDPDRDGGVVTLEYKGWKLRFEP
jgi:hypothetical protein